MQKFWKKQNVKNYLIQDLFDVDEIVRRFGGCANDEDYKIERSYYYWEWQGDENYEIIYTSKEEYDKLKDNEDFNFYTELNYKEFEDKFWFDAFEDVLFKFEVHSQNDFLIEINNFFYELKFEAQAIFFFKEIFEGLNSLIRSLDRLLLHKTIESEIEINKIREIVILIFKESYIESKKRIIEEYKLIFPNIEFEQIEKLKDIRVNIDRDKILNKLIYDSSKIDVFKDYEKKLITHKYLDDSLYWIKSPSDFVRFYSYCEKMRIFKYHYENNSKGITHLRNLYNFQEGKNIDVPSKRRLQINKSKINTFEFLK